MNAEEEAGSVGPSGSAGGRVEGTGIAPVHRGEHKVPVPGGEAVAPPHAVGAGTGPVLNYHFPVEIQAVGSLPESESAQLLGQAFDQIGRELASRL
ncbi:hypothetical protein AB0M32_34390 [Streptomyces sp. NPDC051985]|uniref:hypothetical protein n=1 Tax=Streptomyces sp. NPDC051985 TaxID=3155807 RepID=UPI00343CC3B3